MTANLADFFYQNAASDPDRDALVWRGGSLSYAQLRDWVETLRGALRDNPEPYVAVLAHRSPVAIAAVLAILAEGKAYVPMNPAFPPARHRHILQRTGLGTLVVGEECADTLAALLAAGARPTCLLVLGQAPRVAAVAAEHGLSHTLASVVAGSNLAPTPTRPPAVSGTACVLFTSGSTGVPKGVCVGHAGVRSYVRSFLANYPIERADRLSQTFDLTFDVSVHDQFVTWSAGATLVLFAGDALAAPLNWAAEQRLTVWFSVPSLPAMLEHGRKLVPNALPGLRLSLFAGEKLTWRTAGLWRSIAPHSRIANLYGPTEATIAITHFELPPDFGQEAAFQGGVPIGRAFPGQQTEIRDPDDRPCPPGVVGSLWLAGDQVTAGYLGEPELTAERFVERDGVRWYRTGDLAMQDASGLLHYGGREDSQVKLNGYRIELGEIEHAALQCSGAAFAVAGIAPLRHSVDEVYCVLPTSLAPRSKELKRLLREHLPGYMVPRHLVFVDEVPLNPSGKMDRLALRERILGAPVAT